MGACQPESKALVVAGIKLKQPISAVMVMVVLVIISSAVGFSFKVLEISKYVQGSVTVTGGEATNTPAFTVSNVLA